jgi:hypothetical protein
MRKSPTRRASGHQKKSFSNRCFATRKGFAVDQTTLGDCSRDKRERCNDQTPIVETSGAFEPCELRVGDPRLERTQFGELNVPHSRKSGGNSVAIHLTCLRFLSLTCGADLLRPGRLQILRMRDVPSL